MYLDLEEDISDWIHTGNVGKLEELVLNGILNAAILSNANLYFPGYADLLLGRTHTVDDAEAINFLEVLPQYQVISFK